MVPSHYLNQWWLDYWRIYASLGLSESTYQQWGLVAFIWKLFESKCSWYQLLTKMCLQITNIKLRNLPGPVIHCYQSHSTCGPVMWKKFPFDDIINEHVYVLLSLIIPHATKLRGGILDSPCSSVRPSVRRRCPDDNLNYFHGISIFSVYVSFGCRSWMWLNMSIVPH